MTEQKFYLKNMVSKSCIKLIELYFQSIEGVIIKSVFLGNVVLSYDKSIVSIEKLTNSFKEIGFEVIEDDDAILTEKIKVASIELIIFSSNNNSIIRNSDYISDRVQEPYDKISKVFSRMTGTTLEKFIIALKIEKVKDLVLEDKLTLSEISYQLDYSSVQYLSKQFKQTTGYTFSEFRNLENPPRIHVDEILRAQ
ncbi:MAG: helix-turn-helix domain-containing protein [Fluviicola sp.]|nr:helix-turn-helix domain-containing protein [Fluviicola sp.]